MIRPIPVKACLSALLVCLLTPPASGANVPKTPAHAPRGRDPFDAKRLGAFVDSVMNAEMKREGIPGAAFVFVRHGRVVYQRGYGLANVSAQRAVDPEKTIWR